MTEAKAPIECFSLAHRKNACRCRNPSVAQDHAPIMQGGFRVKDRQDQLDRKIAIDHHTRFLVNANGRVAFDGNECAKLLVGQLCHCFGQIVHCLPLFAR